MPEPVTGILDVGPRGPGALRQPTFGWTRKPNDAFVAEPLWRRYGLRPGVRLTGEVRPGPHGRTDLASILTVNGKPPEEWAKLPDFETRDAVDPTQRLRLETDAASTSMRVLDLLTPIGRGQRALIVAAPRTGKTILLQQLAAAVAQNHPDVVRIALLIDERPEECTDFRRNFKGEVYASTNDHEAAAHLRVAQLTLDYAKRRAEAGEDVLMVLDSITRLGRAANLEQEGSGRTMSGGVDVKALQMPKKTFGAARTMEGGGSLTIVGTALIETNSRMDELIFREFKGTGNMEIVLDRPTADARIFPAIDIEASGTRKEHLLLGRDLAAHQNLRRALVGQKPPAGMQHLLGLVAKTKSNAELLRGFG